MPKLSMSFACGLYDRMSPLQTGEVQADGIDINFIPVHHPRDLFDRMVAGLEFDASEMSASEYITRHVAGKSPFIAIPVFPSRMFRHGFITVNTRLIKTPKDLEGKKIGVQLYTMTAAVWIRAVLQQDLKLDLSGVQWIEGAIESPAPHGKPTVLPPLKPVSITANKSGKSLSQLLEDGEIAAVIGADLPTCYGKAEHIQRLFRNFKEEEKAYFRRTGVFPIMHLVVLRRDFHERHPFVATSLFNALNESKALALRRMRYLGALRYMLPWLPSELDEIDEVFGDDPWPYGVEDNRKPLEALVKALHEQSMTERIVPIEELFAPVRGHNWRRDTTR
jgi:4,5-dihydroxyphthalate decarboxylase